MDCSTALTILDIIIAIIGLMFILLAAFEYTRLAKLRREFHEFEDRLKRAQHQNQKALQRVIASYGISDVDSKIDLLKSAIATDPDVFNAYNALGYAYLEKGDTYGAIDCFKEAINHHPEAKEGYLDLARAYIKVKRLDLARTYLDKAIEADESAKQDIENDQEIQAALAKGI